MFKVNRIFKSYTNIRSCFFNKSNVYDKHLMEMKYYLSNICIRFNWIKVILVTIHHKESYLFKANNLKFLSLFDFWLHVTSKQWWTKYLNCWKWSKISKFQARNDSSCSCNIVSWIKLNNEKEYEKCKLYQKAVKLSHKGPDILCVPFFHIFLLHEFGHLIAKIGVGAY